MDVKVMEVIPSKTIPAIQEILIDPATKVRTNININRNDAVDCNRIVNLCRICATNSSKLISVFGTRGKSLRLAFKINKYLPITVNENDKLPIQACENCINKLDATIQLIGTCIKAQLQLAELLIPKGRLDQEGTAKEKGQPLKFKLEDETDDEEQPIDEMFTSNPSGFTTFCEPALPENENVVIESKSKIKLFDTGFDDDDDDENYDDYDNDDRNDQDNDNDDRNDQDNDNNDRNDQDNVNDDRNDQDNDSSGENIAYAQRNDDNEPLSHDDQLMDSASIHHDGVNNDQQSNDKAVHQTKHESDTIQKSINQAIAEMKAAQAAANKSKWMNTAVDKMPKKPKFKVVVVKVKNNGKLPDHSQIAQTLRELNLDVKNEGTKKDVSDEPPKEGHVVIINKNAKPLEEKTDIEFMGNDQTAELHMTVEKKKSDSEIKMLEPAKDDEVTVPDHSYTHWNQKHEICNYCSETFIGRVNLISHQMKEHKSNVFCCFRCDKVFYDSKAEYDKHVEAHCISSNTRVKKAHPEFEKKISAKEETTVTDPELKVTAVARVSVDEAERANDEQSDGAGGETVKESKSHKSGMRMKLSKEFEGMDPNLKSKIMGTIQKLVRRSRFPTLRNISCPICKIKFVSVTALETHRRIKHDERLPCRFCSRLCRSEAALKKHESHYHAMEFRCGICSDEFKSRNLLRKHELKHLGDRPYKCNTCGKSYTSRGSLQIHETTHSSEKPYLCDKCGKGFKHVSNLNAHKRTHSDDPSVVKAHQCPICSKPFRCQFLVREHMRVHTGDKPFVCEHCGKSFYKKQQLRQHSAVHSPIPQFKCNVCGARFNRKGNMMQHQKRHGKQGLFTCRVCGENFASIGLVLRHRRTHGEDELEAVTAADGEEEDPELAMACKCELCGKLLSSKVSLMLHMRTHTGERPYTCGECGKSFSQSTSLRVHERTHTGEKPYTCSSCSRSFSSRAALTVHERSHTGERPYACKECFKSFRCAAALRQHSSTHSDDRPFPCEYCGKKFRRKEALEIHQRTHTGERPYSCKQCGRRFAQKGDARKHERTHEKSRRLNSVPGSVELLDECSNSFECQPLSLVEITTDSETCQVQPCPPMHTSLQLENGEPLSNLPPGTIIINAQDLMTSSSEITVVAEEDLSNHILGNGISIHYED